MKKAGWILKSATSAALVAGTGCPSRLPPEEPEPAEVCTPMPPEDWARTRTQPHIVDVPQVRDKLDYQLIGLLQNVERVNAGQPASRHPNIVGVPLRCIPAELMVLVTYRGIDMQPLLDAGLRAPGQKPRADLETNLAIGVVSPARLMELALVPSGIGISASSRMGLELSDSVPLIRATRLRDQRDGDILQPYPTALVWVARTRGVGTGEGSAGLRYDRAVEAPQAAPPPES